MIQGFQRVCCSGLRFSNQSRSCSTTSIKAEWRKRRNIIYNQELQRQRSELGRPEKVKITFIPTHCVEKPNTMMMNLGTSTPFDCARHVSETVQENAAIALVDDQVWDMHRPFEKDCTLKLLTMEMPNETRSLNNAYWRTCSFILGAMAESSFKDDVQLYLHSFPPPNLKSGSFIHDVVIDLEDWRPTNAELKALSAQFVRLTTASSLPMERLEVSEEIALDMFQDNPYKSKQIPDMVRDNKLTLYRLGDHIDISRGPMVAGNYIIGRVTIASVHKVESEETDRMYRFQGISIPRGIRLNHFAYSILEDRARQLNTSTWVNQFQPEYEEPEDTQRSSGEETSVAAAQN
ncbi:hypothetical protein QAD02_009020 [Eretmocerus hayati]|uniref:Uncharacterized protein n=1 Tax=Eretmocerus hayati TaxID=131215 RepID=A0ACC2N8D0_9HYME|nr:hypothetical protein QAD02_009020 [Eretmocerus hayati]